MNAAQLQEQLASFVETLVEDASLHAWFSDLKELPEQPRRLELTRMAEKMRLAGEDRGLIGATQLLAQPHIFEGVSKAVEELRGAG